jgi:hypothetical protein
MSNVIPFADRPKKKYPYSAEAYITLIFMGLRCLYGDDDVYKAAWVTKNCPRFSTAMLEQLHNKVSKSCQEKEELEKNEPPIAYDWMLR